MVAITFKYLGDLHCEAVHGPSGTKLDTDAPKDNMGRGESFSPTDLVATALGSCILTTMAIAANRLGLVINGATASVEKQMVSTPVRRIEALPTIITMPAGIAPEHRATLEKIAHQCPVAKSLHPDIALPITFRW